MMIDRIFEKTCRRIGIAAPSSPIALKKLTEGVRALEAHGAECVFGEGLLFPASLPWLAAPDVARAACFNGMVRNGSVDGILCLRGGCGAGRILDRIDWDALKERPDFAVIGFSDITAIHCGMLAYKAGKPVVSRMLSGFAEAAKRPAVLKSMKRALETAKYGKKELKRRPALRVLKCGCAEGGILPVNLTVFASLCGTRYFPDVTGMILAIEDIHEEPYRIDRILNQLRLGGVFDKVKALVFGEFTECGKPSEMRDLKKVWSISLSIPVFEGLKFGHTPDSLSFVCGEQVRIEADGTFYY